MKNLQIRQLLKERLNFSDFYWYPLSDAVKTEVVEYFEADCFLRNFGLDQLKALLMSLGYSQLWEITEVEEDKLITVEELDEYCGVEVIYCDEAVELGIYFSHENTVTFAGEKIIAALKDAWVDWLTYRDPWGA